MTQPLLSDKRAFIAGVASTRSIAAGITQSFAKHGADVILSYQNEKLKSRVEKLGTEVNAKACVELDVASDDSIEQCRQQVAKVWDKFDIIVHSVAYAPREALEGRYIDSVTRESFAIAHDISAYSFAALAKAFLPMLRPGGSLITLSYLGAVRAVSHYNVMSSAKAALEANVRQMALDLGPDNIRVNAISAGPIRTLAASGVKGFRSMLGEVERVAPLKRNVTIEEVGNAATFLCSDLSSGITGEILYVDAGYSQVGLAF